VSASYEAGASSSASLVIETGHLLDGLAAQYGLSRTSATHLETLAAMVLDPNENVLEARPASPEFVVNRIASSLAALELEQVRSARRIADIGSGLGFPGLVLAAALPHARVVVIEKRPQRSEFLRRASTAMGLTNVEVVQKHVQSWAEGFEGFDVATVKTVARPNVSVRFAAPLVTVGGAAVIWGNPKRDPEREAEAASTAEALGLRPVNVVLTAPIGGTRRHLLIYEKMAATVTEGLSRPRPVSPSRLRQERKRVRANTVAAAHDKALERLERVHERVRELEQAQANAGDPGAVDELERALAVVRKVERRVEILTGRRARSGRKVKVLSAHDSGGESAPDERPC
jgi:16S rRNA (guanine527-N7)-methyltransferase